MSEVFAIVPSDRLEEIVCRGIPTSAETHDMAVELLNRRAALASEAASQVPADSWHEKQQLLLESASARIATLEAQHRIMMKALTLIEADWPISNATFVAGDALSAILSAAATSDWLPKDVVALVIAARVVAFEDQSPKALKALDKASEAFADRVPWDDEPAAPDQEGPADGK